MTFPLTTSLLPTSGDATGQPRTLVVLPSLGTAAVALWADAANLLPSDVRVIAVDLPGHGASASPWNAPASTSVEELAESVWTALHAAVPNIGTFTVAGDSIGGAIALQLALSYPADVQGAVVLCSGAQIGDPAAWEERAGYVETAGTPTQVSGSAQRWFAPGFLEAHPVRSATLLHSLQDADRFAYAALCRALATFDVRERLNEITVPVLAVAGQLDQPTPPASLREVAAGVQRGEVVEVPGAAHLVPIEAPQVTAELITGFLGDSRFDEDADFPAAGASTKATSAPASTLLGAETPVTATGLPDLTRSQVLEEGMRVRREVLSDAHVDRAEAAKTDFTRDFQDLISRYAWGEIWTRPGLERRMRSAITLTAMVAGSHHGELAMHVKAAMRNGLSRDEIKEILLQSAIYCSVPSANTAFTIASQALEEWDAEQG